MIDLVTLGFFGLPLAISGSSSYTSKWRGLFRSLPDTRGIFVSSSCCQPVNSNRRGPPATCRTQNGRLDVSRSHGFPSRLSQPCFFRQKLPTLQVRTLRLTSSERSWKHFCSENQKFFTEGGANNNNDARGEAPGATHALGEGGVWEVEEGGGKRVSRDVRDAKSARNCWLQLILVDEYINEMRCIPEDFALSESEMCNWSGKGSQAFACAARLKSNGGSKFCVQACKLEAP